jgi:TrmH family RNA methyltransferase
MRLDDIKKLHQKKYRNELGCFLVEGEHLILELEKAAKANPLLRAATLYASESYGVVQTDFELMRVSDKKMQQIADTKSPQGIVAVVPISAVLTPPQNGSNERTIYLHEIQDPGNLGTILRTLAWFGGFNCVLSPNSVDPYNPKVVRASMGAIFNVPIEVDVSLSTLQTRFDRFACLDIEGLPLSSPQFTDHRCFVFGNEARGVPHEQLASLAVESFSIHGNGVLESLNLAAAVNMCAYELNR